MIDKKGRLGGGKRNGKEQRHKTTLRSSKVQSQNPALPKLKKNIQGRGGQWLGGKRVGGRTSRGKGIKGTNHRKGM